MYNRPPTIGEYLLRKLESYDIEHIFGVPGDYVLRFYNLIEQSPIQHIGMTREDAAGYAADAYARIKGMGAACVTYCVGGLSMVIADVGDSLFGAAELRIHRHTNFISPAYYTSMGFAVPASVGAQLSMPHTRCLVIVGDGAFQMTGTELSTVARYGLNPIVLVLNNHGYGTERHLLDGPFNDIGCWNYSSIPTLFGTGRGFYVRTEGEFDAAIREALAETQHFTLIEAELGKLDTSPALARLAERMSGEI